MCAFTKEKKQKFKQQIRPPYPLLPSTTNESGRTHLTSCEAAIIQATITAFAIKL